MKQVFNIKFHIAGITLLLSSDEKITCDKEFSEFKSEQKEDYVIQFRKIDEMQKLGIEPVAEEMGFRVFCIDNRYFHQFFDIYDMAYAKKISDWKAKKITVDYLKKGIKNISHTGGAFFHIGWEEILLREQRMILHACCVETSLGGILFSGKSGIGKSTQGDLWCRYENAILINGDRPILYKKDNHWIAYGSPYAGSSKCHVNKYVKVKAIVMLAQAKECSIRRIDLSEAFRKVFAQVTVGIWDPENITIACDLAEQLVSDIPVYELACTPDINAVNLLKETLLRR